jgi:hypothetical protein
VNDDALEEVLRRGATLFDPVPWLLLQTAVDAHALVSLDEDLAELTFDSLTQAAPVRGGGEEPRLLTFTGGGLTLDLEFSHDRVLGQLLPPQPATWEFLGTTTTTVTTDDLGRFSSGTVPSGPFSIRCRTRTTTVTTEWVTV